MNNQPIMFKNYYFYDFRLEMLKFQIFMINLFFPNLINTYYRIYYIIIQIDRYSLNYTNFIIYYYLFDCYFWDYLELYYYIIYINIINFINYYLIFIKNCLISISFTKNCLIFNDNYVIIRIFIINSCLYNLMTCITVSYYQNFNYSHC